jgi:RHS repeat-associated protein
VAAGGHPVFQRQLGYDAMNRLTRVVGSIDGAPFLREYAYDSAGNFTRNHEFSADPIYLEPAASNRIRGVRPGGVDTPLFYYDVAGNTTAMPGQTLEWDARGRLTRVVRADGATTEFAYGYQGERVRSRFSHNGVTRETLYVDRVYEVRDSVATRFVFNEDVRIAAVVAAGSPRFFHHDYLGNTVLVTDVAGAILHELGYFAFGTSAFSVGAGGERFAFLGNETDEETGLVYCRSRYYDPRLGRFLSPDLLIVLNPEKILFLPGGFNPYVYSANNPMRYVDSEGAWWKWLLGGLLIAALVVATVLTTGAWWKWLLGGLLIAALVVATVLTTGIGGFAFGILLAATIGSSVGAGVGVYSAWRRGGDLADGFLFGALVGAAAGAAGYALGAAVTGALGGVWGSILGGAAEDAIVGAGNGATVGYAGGKGTWQEMLINAGVGFCAGLVLVNLVVEPRHLS